jgi:hypothetical protein
MSNNPRRWLLTDLGVGYVIVRYQKESRKIYSSLDPWKKNPIIGAEKVLLIIHSSRSFLAQMILAIAPHFPLVWMKKPYL